MRINIYRGQVDTNNAIINANGTKNGVNCGANDGTNGAEVPLNKEQTQIEKLLQIIEKNPSATQACYAEEMGISKRTVAVKMWSNQENRCEVVIYAMHSSGINSLAVGLSPYKIAKIDAFASKLAGRLFSPFCMARGVHKFFINN